MTTKVYTVTDLGPGDGGKGGVIHCIAKMRRAHTIIKVSGAQGSHGVSTSSGERFAFSQWGCGTFEGVRTHISPRFVVSPEALLNEANALRYECGVHEPFALLTVDEGALCATPYHGIASRLKELARGASPRGTIGTGIGEAYRDSFRFPSLVIRVRDCRQTTIRDQLAAVRAHQVRELAAILSGDFLSEDRELVEHERDRLNDDAFLEYCAARFQEVGRRTTIVDADFLGRDILSREGTVVVESSHGVLTDSVHGFHPHTSALRTLPHFTDVMLSGAGYKGQIVRLGVTRAYQIRHGAGPLPTADPSMAETLLPGSNKMENRWQGKVRVGPMDCVLLRYALAACAPTRFDGLAITWFDQLQANGVWRVAQRYTNAVDPTFFTTTGDLRVRGGDEAEQHEYHEALGAQLQQCVPEITDYPIQPGTERDELYTLCAGVLHEQLGIPVRMVSFGPTERDKLCR